MSNSWDNLIMNLSHVIKLDLDSMIASLLSQELRKKSLEKPTSSLEEHTLTSKRSNSKFGKANNSITSSGNFKGKGGIRCIYKDKVGYNSSIVTSSKSN